MRDCGVLCSQLLLEPVKLLVIVVQLSIPAVQQLQVVLIVLSQVQKLQSYYLFICISQDAETRLDKLLMRLGHLMMRNNQLLFPVLQLQDSTISMCSSHWADTVSLPFGLSSCIRSFCERTFASKLAIACSRRRATSCSFSLRSKPTLMLPLAIGATSRDSHAGATTFQSFSFCASTHRDVKINGFICCFCV